MTTEQFSWSLLQWKIMVRNVIPLICVQWYYIIFFLQKICRRYQRCCDFGNKENSEKIIGSVYTTNVYCERWVDKYLLYNLVSFISKTFWNYVSVVLGNRYCRDILYIFIVVGRLFKHGTTYQNKCHIYTRNNISSQVSSLAILAFSTNSALNYCVQITTISIHTVIGNQCIL